LSLRSKGKKALRGIELKPHPGDRVLKFTMFDCQVLEMIHTKSKKNWNGRYIYQTDKNVQLLMDNTVT
jgi:hypothetical protein